MIFNVRASYFVLRLETLRRVGTWGQSLDHENGLKCVAKTSKRRISSPRIYGIYQDSTYVCMENSVAHPIDLTD